MAHLRGCFSHPSCLLSNPAPMAENSSHLDKVKTVTLGCRLNQYESARMEQMAASAGLGNAIIVNTCAVTGEAVRQARQTIRRLSRAHPESEIIITGCAAQIDPEGFSAMPEVTRVVGNQEKMNASAWQTIAQTSERVLVNDIMTVRETAPQLLLQGKLSAARAYVQIQNGCDHRCTFCIIPYGRGNARSVPMGDIVREVQNLVERGAAEVVLTGVDITSYGPDLPGGPSLGDIVQKILNLVPDLPRLRLSSIDGAEIDDTLFRLIVEEERIAPHLHLSLQAGDDMILKRMKRRHNRAQAIEFCKAIKAARPQTALGADLIAGFPTETEAMFENTRRLIGECDIVYTHIFPFSPRKGTPAALMPQVEKKTIKARAAILREEGARQLGHFLKNHIGQTLPVLIESCDGQGHIKGRLADFAEVKLTATTNMNVEIGASLPVDIIAHEGSSLLGIFHQARGDE